jgi:hypothetical protein
VRSRILLDSISTASWCFEALICLGVMMLCRVLCCLSGVYDAGIYLSTIHRETSQGSLDPFLT